MSATTLLPKYIAELGSEIKNMRPCFLGYAHVNPRGKLLSIKGHDDGPNNWTRNLSEEELLDLVRSGIDHSVYLEKEASKYNLNYFDTSLDFGDSLNKAIRYLTGASS